MPTIESRFAPDGAVTYRAKVRIKGARQVSASFPARRMPPSGAMRRKLPSVKIVTSRVQRPNGAHSRTRSIATSARYFPANRARPSSKRASAPARLVAHRARPPPPRGRYGRSYLRRSRKTPQAAESQYPRAGSRHGQSIYGGAVPRSQCCCPGVGVARHQYRTQATQAQGTTGT